MRDVFRWIPPILWMAMIFTMSSIPDLPELPGGFRIGDKTAHMVAYLCLAALWFRAFALNRECAAHAAGFAFLLSVGFGLTDEWHQSFVPGRRVELLDWLADAAGAAFGVGISSLCGRR